MNLNEERLRRIGTGLVIGCLLAAGGASAAPVNFERNYSATEGMVTAAEQPFRQELCLNGKWQFQPVGMPPGFKNGSGTPPELTLPLADKWEQTPIKIPSPWNVNRWGNGRDAGEGTKRPYVADSVYYPSYPASWDGVRMAWLRKTFRVPSGWQGKRWILHFEAVAGEARVLVNGREAGRHFDSFLPFEFDVTDLVNANGENELLVGVRKNDLFNIISPDYPQGQQRTYPQGSNMDNLAGIWNDVYLWALPETRVEDVFVQPLVDQDMLKAEVTLRNDGAQERNFTVSGEASPWINRATQDVLTGPEPKWQLGAAQLVLPSQTVALAPGEVKTIALQAPVDGKLKFWSPDSPNLYGLVVSVAADGKVQDKKYTRFGWRQFTISGRDFLLNGKPIRLVGDFTHPFGPYVCSRRFAWADYKMIKDFGGNALRPHANIMPRFWLDLADEMGICIMDETSIFGSSINLNLKEQITWERMDRHVDGLVLRDRNHPSVFGWGPGNEMFALFFKTKEDEKKVQYARLKEFALRPARLDPTRQWISVDGDQDLEGVLPVWSRHIGMGLPKDDLAAINKPRMIGEHGGTYYAGPALTAKINGDRSYESYAGRNEALAVDLYKMAVSVARPELNFFSASELIWFGLEQLPLGYSTDQRAPNLSDGVIFPKYEEGVPGMQVERIPPYVMTLNPGFDPALPAYKPMAMFEAMKAAFDPRGPQPCKWDKEPTLEPRPTHPTPKTTVTKVGFYGSRQGPLFHRLVELGVPLSGENEAAENGLLLIDGESVDANGVRQAQNTAEKVWGNGGTVWVMFGDKGASLSKLGSLLAGDLSLTTRTSTLLIPDRQDPLTAGFTLGDLYFVTESGDPQIQKAGLAGALVKSGKVLLTASNTDWSLFERKPENAKCGSMLIYEHLAKPEGAALVEIPKGKGRLLVSTLDIMPNEKPYVTFWKQLFGNLGVQFGTPSDGDADGKGRKAHDLLLDGPIQ
jgi:beta-galactosidase